MFAKIDSELLDIFLTPEEIESAAKKSLKGKIITAAKTKAGFELFVDDKKSGRYGISVQENKGGYSVFTSADFYESLKEDGYAGARYDALGRCKINLMDISRLDDEKKMELKLLKKFYE